MRAVLSTYGGRGDVEPLVALAVQLRALGAEVPGVRTAGLGAGDRRRRAVARREVAVPVRSRAREGAAITGHAVVIARGGPTGLALAGERLARGR